MTERVATRSRRDVGESRAHQDIGAVTGQYLAEKQYSLFIPIYILVLYWTISVIIVLFMGIKAGLPLPTVMQESNATYNTGAIMSLPYFLIVVGALCVNRQFGAALAFGSTRRDFWLGTMMGFIITSSIIGVFTMLGLAAEQWTNHWWFGVYAFDVAVLGSGNYGIAWCTMFILSLVSLLIGATYGTVFRSFGAKTLTVAIVVTSVVTLGIFAIFIWQSTAIIAFFAPWGYWTISAVLAAICIVMSVVGYFVNQRAIV